MNHAFLNRSYSRDEFINFAKDFLPDFGYEESSVRVSHNSLFNSAQTLGSALDGELAILEIAADSSSVGRRIAITKEAFKILRDHGMSNALVAFDDGHGKWRLSLLTTTLKLNEAGKVISEASNPRRYSYLLGVGAKTVTPYKYLIEKGKVENIKQLQERFSVEVVNKQFYTAIASLFTKLIGGERSGIKYPGLLKLNGVVTQSAKHQEFAVRLIGRIIFCWFLKEKKSSSGNPIIDEELLSLEALGSNSDYYHTVLEPLFFELLNKPFNDRDESLRTGKFASVPYLNGGLFGPHTGNGGDHYEEHLSTSGVDSRPPVFIPDGWFKELFTILEKYNFTVDENTSYDVDLSIDPEMLGRIFENLLAEINPETGESARKSTGSFYTPREIVDYMVDSSLLEFLKGKTSVSEDKLKALISWDRDDDDEHPLTETEKKNIVDALATLTILDPACGSGAFPIGILQKVVYILQQVDQEGKLWLEKQLASNALPEFRRYLEQQNYDYIRKLGIIRESIFGVDIQTIATEISKLRCFLTLVIEEDVNDDMTDNRGIQPLPNLEFKFVTANSLIGLNESEKVALGDEKLDKLESRLFELRTKRYFQTKSSEEKAALREEDKQLCLDILLATAGVVGINEKDIEKWERDIADAKNALSSLESQFIEKTQGRLFGEDDVTQLRLLSLEENNLKQTILTLQSKIRNERKKVASTDLANKLQLITSWSPYDSSSSASFFDSKWMFGLDSFDIVIANPPYIGESGHKTMFDRLKVTPLGNKFYKGKMDLFYFFFHLGLDNLHDGGIISFISTNYYPTAAGAVKLRKDFYDRTNVIELINFNEYRIFESALGQHNLITLLQKTKSPEHDYKTKQTLVKKKGGPNAGELNGFLARTSDEASFSKMERARLFDGDNRYIRFASDRSEVDSVLDKIALEGVPLGVYFNINVGIQPGAMAFTDAQAKKFPDINAKKGEPIFIFARGQLGKLVRNNDIIKPWFKSSDIHRYITKTDNSKEIALTNFIARENQEPELISYLSRFKEILINRSQPEHMLDWWDLHQIRMKDKSKTGEVKKMIFDGPKIVVPYRSTTNKFAYSDRPFYGGTDLYIITQRDRDINLKSMTAILNSRLIYTWLYHRGKRKGETLELFSSPLREIPIVLPKDNDEKRLTTLVDDIITIRATDSHADTSALESQINHLVYTLYNLTPEEIAVVEAGA